MKSGCQHYRQDWGDCPPPPDAVVKAAAKARERITTLHSDGTLPLLHLTKRRDDLDAARQVADFLVEGSNDVIFLGTGGSSLGGQAIAQLAGYRVPGREAAMRPRLQFFDNLDARSLDEALQESQLRHAKVLAISKSGNTPETLVQVICVMEALKRSGIRPAERIAVLTEPDNDASNPLRRIAQDNGLITLDHDPGTGGRFSALFNVGMVPAMVANLDVEAIRAGAHDVMHSVLHDADAAPVSGAAHCAYLQTTGRMRISVMMPYSDSLRLFSAWYAQLWAESLGKNGQGSQPVAAAGPVDQHSQMQLFLDGPEDKLVNIIMPDSAGSGAKLPETLASDPQLAWLANRRVGDVTACQQRATAEVLAKNGKLVRAFAVERVDEASLGALMMHFMLETILVGFMMEIDPFDQPAVEQGKDLTRKCLAAMKV